MVRGRGRGRKERRDRRRQGEEKKKEGKEGVVVDLAVFFDFVYRAKTILYDE